VAEPGAKYINYEKRKFIIITKKKFHFKIAAPVKAAPLAPSPLLRY
jgi:hypothetical protein